MRQSEFKACLPNLCTLHGIYEPSTIWHVQWGISVRIQMAKATEPQTCSVFFGGRRACELIITNLLYKELYGLYKNAAADFYFHEVSVKMHKTRRDLEPICFVSDMPLVWDFGHVTVVSF